MLTLQQFIDKWDNKGIDFDGHYGYQCVDLYRQYVQEVLGCPQSPGVIGAKDIWDSYLSSYFDRIPNTPEGVPEAGDIMIWGSVYGAFGHVAIVTEATVSTFKCFSQNDPTGAVCGIKLYRTYKPTLGWLHPKFKDSMYKGYDLSNSESMKIAVDTLVELQNGLLIRKEQVDQITNDLNKKLVDQATAYEKDKQLLLAEIKSLKESLQKINDSDSIYEKQALDYEKKLKGILGKFAGVGVSMSPENDEVYLSSTVSDYLSTYTKLESDNELLGVRLLDTQETVANLEKVIVDLKKNEKAFKVVKLGKLTIKFYR